MALRQNPGTLGTLKMSWLWKFIPQNMVIGFDPSPYIYIFIFTFCRWRWSNLFCCPWKVFFASKLCIFFGCSHVHPTPFESSFSCLRFPFTRGLTQRHEKDNFSNEHDQITNGRLSIHVFVSIKSEFQSKVNIFIHHWKITISNHSNEKTHGSQWTS